MTWWDDRGHDRIFIKIALRLAPNAARGLLTGFFLKKLRLVAAAPISRILIVKGDGMSVAVISALKRQFPGARLSLYLWDSVDNAPHARQIAPMFDLVATFDLSDAGRFGWKYRPLFARGEVLNVQLASGEPLYDWSFIGTLHSDRYRIVEKLRQSDPSRKTFLFGYFPSRLLLVMRVLSGLSLKKSSGWVISTSAMPAAGVSRVCRSSRATLDVEHPLQRGLTMRTIETLLSGKKLITTNRHILDSDLFHPSRVHVISRQMPKVPKCFYDEPFEPLSNAIGVTYSLRHWIVDLIGTRPQEV